MAAAHNQPTEIDQVCDQHDCHQAGEGQQQHIYDVRARGRGIGWGLVHARNGASARLANRSARVR